MSDAVIVALIAAGASLMTVLLQIRERRYQHRMARKVEETHTQVTVNSHKSEQPTLLDKLDELARRMDKHEELHRNSW